MNVNVIIIILSIPTEETKAQGGTGLHLSCGYQQSHDCMGVSGEFSYTFVFCAVNAVIGRVLGGGSYLSRELLAGA